MNQITHVFVTVPEGRLVPVPAGEGAAAGGALLMAEPGKLYAVKWSTFTRKRINGGDFILSNKIGKPVKSPNEAAAPADIRLAADGSVDPDQRSDEEIAKSIAHAKAKAKAEGEKADTKAPSSFDTSDTGKDR